MVNISKTSTFCYDLTEIGHICLTKNLNRQKSSGIINMFNCLLSPKLSIDWFMLHSPEGILFKK